VDFVSFNFGAALLGALSVYRLLPERFRQGFLAALNVGLLFWVAPGSAVLVVALSLAVFLAVRWRRSPAVAVVPLLVLAYCKYGGFMAGNLTRLGMAVPVPPVVGVLGLSYFAFRLTSFCVDVGRKDLVNPSFVTFVNYVFFFSTVVAGPIDRYGAFREASVTWEQDLLEGASRIIMGFFKKIVIAGHLYASGSALGLRDLSPSAYILGMYAYTVLIYCDFSGYSDIAIGTARLFGYRVMENFASPYTKRNLSAFWKCWHISLTRWFRDYLFIPLGGSRGTLGRTLFNTLLVMLATGVWHGASWNFVLWGLYHAVGLVAYRLYSTYVAVRLPRALTALPGLALASWLVMFHFVAVGWILFATSTSQFLYILGRLRQVLL
jgi:alginate O-acetyltransferase complex protein AlgI